MLQIYESYKYWKKQRKKDSTQVTVKEVSKPKKEHVSRHFSLIEAFVNQYRSSVRITTMDEAT